MTLIEVTITTAIIGTLATISYASILSNIKENAQIAEAKLTVREFAYQNQEAILAGAPITAPPNSQNFGYSFIPVPVGKIIVATHRGSNARIFTVLKDSGKIEFCDSIKDCGKN